MNECTERYSTERRHNAQNSVAQEIEYILKSVEDATGNAFQQVGTVIAAKIALENIMKDWKGQEMKMCEEMIKLRKELDTLGIKLRRIKTMAEIIINKEQHECPPAVAAYVKELDKYNKALLSDIAKKLEEIAELKAENARLEELYQKSVGVIAATDCAACKNKVYRKAYNDVMNIRANIQEIIEDVRKNNGGAENETY